MAGLGSPEIFWDRADYPISLLSPREDLITLVHRHYRPPLPYLLLRYIPLYRNSSYVNAITIHCGKTRMNGIETHFDGSSYLYGFRKAHFQAGCALHFALQPDERILRVWVRQFMPFLMVSVLTSNVVSC